jgi:pimeloyl-ACP methyl ester carboxylesterase
MLQSRKLFSILFAVGALYLLLLQQFFKHEGHFLIQSPQIEASQTYSFKTNFQELNLPINKEVNLNGIWFKQPGAKSLILLFPDSDEDISRFQIESSAYFQNGFDVLIPAYRGAAKSTGKLTSENDLFLDAQNWYHFANSQFKKQNISVAGQGFGCSIAAHLAASQELKAVILENPTYSYGDYLARKRFWCFAYDYFTKFPLETWKDIRRSRNKIFLLQDEAKKGDDNSLIKFLKNSDRIFWLKQSDKINYSFDPANKNIFQGILSPLNSK